MYIFNIIIIMFKLSTLVISTFLVTASGQTLRWVQDEVLIRPSELNAYDYFGYSTTMYDDKMAIGGRHFITNDHSGDDVVYTFQWNGTAWVQDQGVLRAPGAQQFNDLYGSVLSMYGDKMAVGARDRNSGGSKRGAVYMYNWNGTAWALGDELGPDTLVDNDMFGSSVSLYNDRLVVGSEGSDGGDGLVYTYSWNGTVWLESDSLGPPTQGTGNYFGRVTTLYNNKMAIGVPGNINNTGIVYTYQWNGTAWTMDQPTLQPQELLQGDQFGYSLVMYGNRLAVSAAWNDTGGSVYTYQWDGGAWIRDEGSLTPSSGSYGHFGYSLSMYLDRLIVGAFSSDGGGVARGSAYTYKWSTDTSEWIEDTHVLVPSELDDGAYFGNSVSLYDDKMVVGAYGLGIDEKGGAFTYQELLVTESPTQAPTPAPCYCNNGGECRNNLCHCPYPYYGQHCDQVATSCSEEC